MANLAINTKDEAAFSPRVATWAVPILLLIFTLFSGSFALKTGPSFDEPGFITAGYGYLLGRSDRIATGNLVLSQTWVALPLLLSGAQYPTIEQVAATVASGGNVNDLFFETNEEILARFLPLCRGMNILLGVLLGWLVFAWTRELFGTPGGIVALALFAFSPVMISNSGLATTDIPAAFLFVAAMRTWWKLLERPSIARLILCGLICGALFTTKLTGVLLLPLFAASGAVHTWLAAQTKTASRARGTVRQLTRAAALGLGVALTVYFTVWIVYGFRYSTAPSGNSPAWSTLRIYPDSIASQLVTLGRRFHLLPEHFLMDLQLMDTGTLARRSFLFGEYSVDGWWYFFPATFILKNPLSLVATMLLVLAGIAFGLKRLKSAPAILKEKAGAVPLLLLGAVYLFVAMRSNINIGVRHLLPMFPCVFIFCGLLPSLLRPLGGRALAICLSGIPAVAAAEALAAYPQFLAYVSPIGGGTRNGHRVVADSSYEWGQDAPALREWVQRRQKERSAPIYLSYFGNNRNTILQLQDVILLPCFFPLRPTKLYALEAGTYVISATMLHSLYGQAFGPWRTSYEERYQQLSRDMLRLAEAGRDQAGIDRFFQVEDAAAWQERVELYDALRLARLCAFLRTREPAARISYGILVFELSTADLKWALEGPPAGLRENYAIKGAAEFSGAELGFLP